MPTNQEVLRNLPLKDLQSRLSGLLFAYPEVEEELKGVIRAIAFKDGDLANSYEDLFPNQKLHFEKSPLGSTEKVCGYSEPPEERESDATPEVVAYLCPACGWVKDEPSKKHVVVGDSVQRKGIEVQLFCTIDSYPLGNLKGSMPASEKYEK